MNLPSLQDLFNAINEEELVSFVKEMIRIPSVNPQDSEDCRRFGVTPGEGELAEMLARRLEKLDLEVELQEVEPGRPNLLARYHGNRSGRRLVFNGHMDTVGAYEMGATAYSPVIRDGCLHGRGAADMKGALACFSYALEILARRHIPLAGEVMLTAVIGEEGPPNGTEHLLENGFTADGVVVGEASECRLFAGQRGGQFVRVTTRGKTAHGSMPQAGINAIEQMAGLLAALPGVDLFKRQVGDYGITTFSTGVIQGGVRTNIVADYCQASLDVRMPPGISPEEVLACFADLMAKMGIEGEVHPEEQGHPAYLTPAGAYIHHSALKALELTGPGSKPEIAPYWSDLAHFSLAGIPAVIYGPGSILRAHSGDEYVEIEHLVRAARFYLALAVLFCRNSDD